MSDSAQIQVVYSTQNLHSVEQRERTCSTFAKFNFYIMCGTFKKTINIIIHSSWQPTKVSVWKSYTHTLLHTCAQVTRLHMRESTWRQLKAHRAWESQHNVMYNILQCRRIYIWALYSFQETNSYAQSVTTNWIIRMKDLQTHSCTHMHKLRIYHYFNYRAIMHGTVDPISKWASLEITCTVCLGWSTLKHF